MFTSLMNRVRAFVTAIVVETSYASQIADLHEQNSSLLGTAAHFHNLADVSQVAHDKLALQIEQAVGAWEAVNERLIERVAEIHLLKQENKAQANLLLESYRMQEEQRKHIRFLESQLESERKDRVAYFGLWKAEADYSTALSSSYDYKINECIELREQLAQANRENDALRQQLSEANDRKGWYRSLYMDASERIAKHVFG